MAFDFDGRKYAHASAHQREWGARLIAALDLRGDEHILDLGCGDGALTARLAELVPRGRVVGVDASPGMIGVAEARTTGNLSFVLMDINHWILEDRFDVIFSNATLHWIADHRRLLSDVHAHLNESGTARFNFGGKGNCPNLDRIVKQVMAQDRFASWFDEFTWPWFMPSVEEYEALVSDLLFDEVRVWNELGVQVWATDLWVNASENMRRIREAGVEESVFPIHADARALPFAGEFFDAILSVDSFSYYGSDGLYLNYLAHFARPGGPIGIAGAGLVREFEDTVPEHLRRFWTQDCWGLHSAEWWRRHWERTSIVDVDLADTMPEGWRVWLDWYNVAHPDGMMEIETVISDQGEYLGYVRMAGRRRDDVKLEDYCWPDTLRSLPIQYERKPLLRARTALHEQRSGKD